MKVSIPTDWKCVHTRDIADLIAGGTPSTNNPEYWNGDIPWMSSGELNLKRVNDVEGRITESGLRNSSAKIIPKHSVLIGLAGQGKTRGTVAINEIPLCTNQSVAAIIPNQEKAFYLYLFYNLEHRYDELRRLSTGDGGRGGLNLRLLGNLRIPLPKLNEQKEIAEVLRAWDAEIDLLDKFITTKGELKNGLMQQLLTGKLRFPEFVKSRKRKQTRFVSVPEDWALLKVGDFAEECSNRAGNGNSIPVLSCTKYDGLVDSLEYFGKRIFSDDTANYKVVQRNQFAYATNHIEEGSIGLLSHLDAGLVSPMYTVFKTNEQVHTSFLYALFKTELYRHIFEANTNSSVNRRGSLRWNQFAQLPVALPSLDEQKKIASVLNTCDREIALLQAQAEALNKQKRGLMQKLLTGQVRLKGLSNGLR